MASCPHELMRCVESNLPFVKNCYECQICLAVFSQSSSLTKHIASVHEGKKPFKCSICDYNCSQKGDLTKHIASVHEGKKTFTVKGTKDFNCPGTAELIIESDKMIMKNQHNHPSRSLEAEVRALEY